jgi:hypothetical protein
MSNEPRKKAREMTTDEALERLFGKDAARKLREIAAELPTPRKERRKPLKKKKKDDDD